MEPRLNLRVNAAVASACRNHGIKIRRADHTGDSCLAVVDPSEHTSVEVGQSELTAFLNECVQHFGKQPPVWAKRLNETEYRTLDLKREGFNQVEDVLVHYPLIGG